MIKINLLGKKKVAAPFGLDAVMERLGISADDLSALRPVVAKTAVVLVGLYLCDYVPSYILATKIAELDKKIKVISDKTTALQAELNSKKEIRKQQEQLDKEESEVNRQLAAINGLNRDRSLVFRAVDGMTTVLPATVWLSKMSYGDHKFSLIGSSWDYFPINDFVKALNESTQFQNVVFKGITTEAPGKYIPGVPESIQKVKNFEVEFGVKGNS
jgi:Tfp pilus assembly protein PilN